MKYESDPIGIFDSGVGGLSVLKEIQSLLPNENIVYFSDQKNVPYGDRSSEELKVLSENITEFLLNKKAKLIVVACNTATAAAVESLRERFSGVLFVGMEPAVKPASKNSRSRIVGVLATPRTFESDNYSSLLKRYSDQVLLLENSCEGLVLEIEKGNLTGPRTKEILKKAIIPMLEKGADTLVLGCTHYPFVIPEIKNIVGEKITIINPAPAIAKQVKKLLIKENLLGKSPAPVQIRYWTTGNLNDFRDIVLSWGFIGEVEKVQ